MRTKALRQFINISAVYFLMVGVYMISKGQQAQSNLSEIQIKESILIAGAK